MTKRIIKHVGPKDDVETLLYGMTFICIIFTLSALLYDYASNAWFWSYLIQDIIAATTCFLTIILYRYGSIKTKKFIKIFLVVFTVFGEIAVIFNNPSINDSENITATILLPSVISIILLEKNKFFWSSIIYALLWFIWFIFGEPTIGTILFTLPANFMLFSVIVLLVNSISHQISISTEERYARKQERDQAHLAEERAFVAEQASRHKTLFLADMSHELRGPLGSIRSSAKLLDRHGALEPKQQRYQEIIIAESNHLLRLINHLLDLEKIEAGHTTLERKPTNILALIEQIIHDQQETAYEKRLTLGLVAAADIPLADIDEFRIKQILLNLISNAIKHTDQGGITIRAAVADNMIAIAVQDTGKGIPSAAHERIFGHYQQVNLDDQKLGTGLGLSITKQLVELHGGRIWIDSTVGSGATFTFTVPVAVMEIESG